MMCPYVMLLYISCLQFIEMSQICSLMFINFERILAIIYLNIFSTSFSYSSPSGTPIRQMLGCLILSHRSLRLCSFFFKFYLSSSDQTIPQSIFELTCFSVTSNVMFSSSSELFVLFTVFFRFTISTCFFKNSVTYTEVFRS